MEEITTRFEIIRLAVKMADHETVSIQAEKLREFRPDEDLDEIIALLENKNYRQALFSMKEYVSFLDESFFDKPSSVVSVSSGYKKQQIAVETKNLFDMMQPQKNKTINLDDMLRMTEESARESVASLETEYTTEAYIAEAKQEAEENEACLDIRKNKIVKSFEAGAAELLSDTDGNMIEHVSVSDASKEFEAKESEMLVQMDEEAENFKETTLAKESISLEIQDETDAPAVEVMQNMTDRVSAEVLLEDNIETVEKNPHQDQKTEASLSFDTAIIEELNTPRAHSMSSNKEESKSKTKSEGDYGQENRRYAPISYIDQKFRNMRHQFPQVEEGENGIIDEVKALLRQMAAEGYTENDIRDAIRFFQQKKAEGHRAEAAQMLLLAAASESKYAQLLLARELFKGDVLQIDYPESFTQINRLAEHDYPEAICDLAQLYEFGYGIKKDKKTALLLFEEAAEMGVERALKHVVRLSSKKGILGAFFK